MRNGCYSTVKAANYIHDMKKMASIIVLVLTLLYTFSFCWITGWPAADHIDTDNGWIYVCDGNVRMNLHQYTRDSSQEFYDAQLVANEERCLHRWYYLIQSYRVFGSYHLYDKNIPGDISFP